VKKILALLLAASLIAPPAFASEWANGTVPTNGKPAGGQQIGTWNGTGMYNWPSDASGTPYVTEYNPTAQTPILHFTNRTLAAAATDSSLVPFSTSGYRVVYGFIRFRQASLAAGSCVEMAMRGHFSAFLDSTQGWWFPIGNGGDHNGKMIYAASQSKRFQSFVVQDSISGMPWVAPYMSCYVKNLTGAQMVYDLWFLGVR